MIIFLILIFSFLSMYSMEQQDNTLISETIGLQDSQEDNKESTSTECSPCSSDRSDHHKSSLDYTQLITIIEQLKDLIQNTIEQNGECTIKAIDPLFAYLENIITINYAILTNQQHNQEAIDNINEALQIVRHQHSNTLNYLQGIAEQFSTANNQDKTSGFNLSDKLISLEKIIKSITKQNVIFSRRITTINTAVKRAMIHKQSNQKSVLLYFKQEGNKMLYQQKKSMPPICDDIMTFIAKRKRSSSSEKNSFLALTYCDPTTIERCLGIKNTLCYEEYPHDPRTNSNRLSNTIEPSFCKKFFVGHDDTLQLLSNQSLRSTLHLTSLILVMGGVCYALLKNS